MVETCFVAPSKKTPTQGLWLSSLDVVLANRGHTPLVYFYRSNNVAADFFDVGMLKAALSKTLVAFYPLAGQLGVDSDGRVEINCNGKGVLFVVARSERTVEDFSDIKPSPELRRLFVPRMDSAEPPCVVLAVQVTFLRCGGVAIGVAVHHVAVDAPSFFHFFEMWSAFTRDGDNAVGELPCHDRTLLCARSPPVVHPDTLSVFCPKLNLSESLGPVLTRVFSISKYHVSTLKRLCETSTFCAVSAHVWQCACIARRLTPDVQTHLSFPINIRRRVRPPLPDRYFGCGLIVVGLAATVEDIVSGTLASVSRRIKGTIDRVDDELVRSAVAYSEISERNGRPAKGSMPETELRVISWLGMPAYDADFGWGKPRVMSRAESVRGGFVYLTSGGPADDGSVRVVMCMEAARLDEFERLLYARLERLPYARF